MNPQYAKFDLRFAHDLRLMTASDFEVRQYQELLKKKDEEKKKTVLMHDPNRPFYYIVNEKTGERLDVKLEGVDLPDALVRLRAEAIRQLQHRFFFTAGPDACVQRNDRDYYDLVDPVVKALDDLAVFLGYDPVRPETYPMQLFDSRASEFGSMMLVLSSRVKNKHMLRCSESWRRDFNQDQGHDDPRHLIVDAVHSYDKRIGMCSSVYVLALGSFREAPANRQSVIVEKVYDAGDGPIPLSDIMDPENTSSIRALIVRQIDNLYYQEKEKPKE